MNRNRIVIIETDSDFKNLYSHLIDNSDKYELVGVYDSFEEASVNIVSDLPDLVLIGLEFIYYDKIDQISRMRKKLRDMEIVIVADFADTRILNTIKHGAMGLLLRVSTLSEIEECLDTVLSGGGFLNSQIARKFVESFFKSNSSPLTNRETEVLRNLADGKTYTMIATDLQISKGTVKTHMKNIYYKLHVSSKADAISKSRKIRLIH